MDRDYTHKRDKWKTMWSLIPWRAVKQVAEVMTQAILPRDQGGSGYGLESWKKVPGGKYRYIDALFRHFYARYVRGEIYDKQSGQLHSVHMATNALFLAEKDLDATEIFPELKPRPWLEENDPDFFERDI